MGCEVIQGYLYSKPQSLEDFRKFLAGDTTLASAKTRSARG
jgi:EAL domain-containing protein (putative c-di-GMP-specific phosphodiesterase class I)